MKTSQIKLKTSLKPYPEYKDSGIDWIGEIPKDWEIASHRRLFSTKKIAVGSRAHEYKVLSLTLKGIIPRVMDGSGKNPAEYDTYQVFQKGDLSFCLFDYDVTPRTIGYVNEDGMMTGAYTRLIPKKEVFSKYFYYYFLSLDNTKELLHLCTGLRNSISKPLFWSMKSSFPNIETQEKIAEYLDEKTELVDQIVEKKKKLIELLKEKRTAIINQAVTKGLDPNAELVDSGIDWIGKIPKDWRIEKLKFLSKVQASNVDKLTEDGLPGVLLCNYVDVYKNECIDASLNFMKSTASKDQIRKVGLRQGDILLTKDSETPDDIGVPAIVTEDIKDLVSGYHLYVVHPKKHSIDSKFLFRYFHSKFIRTYFELHSNGITRFGLGSAAVDSAKILLPGLSDQIRIASYLDEKTKLVDKSIDLIKVSVEKLKEFKVSLISGTITGKVMIK